jgi:hypothetical protein
MNGGNYEAARQAAPTLPAQAAGNWPAPQATSGCPGSAESQSVAKNDVLTMSGSKTAATPWLDIRRVSFFRGPKVCVEIELGAPLRPDTRIEVSRGRGEGTGGMHSTSFWVRRSRTTRQTHLISAPLTLPAGTRSETRSSSTLKTSSSSTRSRTSTSASLQPPLGSHTFRRRTWSVTPTRTTTRPVEPNRSRQGRCPPVAP